MFKLCQNKKKQQHRRDNIDHYRNLEKKERKRNYSNRKNNTLAQAKTRYYSSDLKYITALMFQNARVRARTSNLEFNIDKEFLIELFKLQNNRCALTGLPFKYSDNDKNMCHRRPFAASLDRINCKKGYTKDNVRLVCIIVNFALCEFGDEAFDEMCESYIINKREKYAK
jgi:hypothetical protein